MTVPIASTSSRQSHIGRPVSRLMSWASSSLCCFTRLEKLRTISSRSGKARADQRGQAAWASVAAAKGSPFTPCHTRSPVAGLYEDKTVSGAGLGTGPFAKGVDCAGDG